MREYKDTWVSVVDEELLCIQRTYQTGRLIYCNCKDSTQYCGACVNIIGIEVAQKPLGSLTMHVKLTVLMGVTLVAKHSRNACQRRLYDVCCS